MKTPFLLAKTENSTGAPRSPKPEGKGQPGGSVRKTVILNVS